MFSKSVLLYIHYRTSVYVVRQPMMRVDMLARQGPKYSQRSVPLCVHYRTALYADFCECVIAQLWELDRATSQVCQCIHRALFLIVVGVFCHTRRPLDSLFIPQRLALSLLIFGPAPCAFKLGVLDALFGAATADVGGGGEAGPGGRAGGATGWFGRRRVPAGEDASTHKLPGCAAAAAAAAEAGMQVAEGLVEHSRRELDAGGQRVHLRIAAVRSCAGSASGSIDFSSSRGRGSRGGRRVGREEAAVLHALEEELLPARVLPIFVWQADTPTAEVVAEAAAFLRSLARRCLSPQPSTRNPKPSTITL